MSVHVAGAEPYAWPYDGRLGGSHLALLLAGWDEEWSGRAVDLGQVATNVPALVDAVVGVGGLVVAVTHGSASLPVDGPHQVVASCGLDGFHDGPLDSLLRRDGRTHLLVAGHGIEGAVHSTLRSANDRGYECLLVTDACSALTDDLPPASAKTVTMSGGIFGAIGTTAAVLVALAASPPPSTSLVTAQEA